MAVAIAALLLLLGASAAAQNPRVRVTWIGQACFMVESEGGPVVITDPSSPATGYPMPATPASVVTVSHNHGDHNYTQGIQGQFTLVDGRDVGERREVTAAGMPFVLLPGSHGPGRGANTPIVWTQSGLKFAHLGDYGQDEPTAEQAAALRGVDVMFVPAGGFFTIDAARAAALIAALEPRVAVLMHYRTALGGPAQLATFQQIAEAFPDAVYKPSTVTLGPLPASREVWLMEPAAEAVVVNAGGFAAGEPVAPGSIVALFGRFGQEPAGTEVLVGGVAAHLFAVTPTQINFQVPARAQGHAVVEVRRGGQSVARGAVRVVPAAPGLFAALNQDGTLNSPSRPARRGEVLQVYATGQGETSPAVEDGVPAPGPPFALTAGRPSAWVGGKEAAVVFSGMEPGAVGLWHLNVQVPADAPSGTEVPLEVFLGRFSRPLPVAIE